MTTAFHVFGETEMSLRPKYAEKRFEAVGCGVIYKKSLNIGHILRHLIYFFISLYEPRNVLSPEELSM